ncbi:MAG: 16S rRNA (guanine(527)-N(7))-methyltransferase RsmG [Leptolyngbyaceae cyanobacterium SL_7_1]|nr:16S rRNA (guanine(527)-N(7))-methyltransferase RsmG [Leptolyngbyaceae cyanobacterium SL_7_1]
MQSPDSTDLSLLPSPIEVWDHTLQWQPNATQQHQFQQLYERVIEGNRQLNLTRIVEPIDFWEKHIWDSLSGIRPWLEEGAIRDQPLAVSDQPLAISEQPLKIIDLGTGAGFPGLPVAIALPHAHVTLLDSTRKKIAFVDTVVEELGLQQVQTICDRAEQIGKQPVHQSAYDLVLIRAVAAVTVCADYALPLLKPDGTAVLYRGQWSDQERDKLERAIAPMGGKITAIDAFTTPLSQSIRHCVYLQTPLTHNLE